MVGLYLQGEKYSFILRGRKKFKALEVPGYPNNYFKWLFIPSCPFKLPPQKYLTSKEQTSSKRKFKKTSITEYFKHIGKSKQWSLTLTSSTPSFHNDQLIANFVFIYITCLHDYFHSNHHLVHKIPQTIIFKRQYFLKSSNHIATDILKQFFFP